MARRTLRVIVLLCVLLVPSVVFAQLPPPDPKPIIGGRMPALSPDGKRLAFVYRGEVWVADSRGGRATVLTRNVEFNGYPVFSPDGNWIAFSSTRTGHSDIFVAPATGGEVRRITYHSTGSIATGWSPDGKSLIFVGRRDTSDTEILTIDVATLRLNKLAQDYFWIADPTFSPDGKSILFGRHRCYWTRPRYHGASSMQIWTMDLATGKRRAIIEDDRQHLWPRFLPDGTHVITVTVSEITPSARNVYATGTERFADSPARTPNLYELDLAGHERRLTHFVGGGVRFPAVAAKSGDIAFEYDKDLWLLPAGATEPKKVALVASEDEAQNTFRHEVLTTGVTEVKPSPDGKTLAFGLKSDLWTIPVDKPKGVEGRDKDLARRLTTWPGDDSDAVWSPDGGKLYFRSDREGPTKVFEMDLATLETKSIWKRPEAVGRVTLSPDGTRLAFWATGGERGLYIVPLDTLVPRRLIRVPEDVKGWQGGGDISWSPDYKWIAFVWTELNGARNIWIAPAEGGTPINVTRLNAAHGMPAWSPDGKYLFFRSNRDADTSLSRQGPPDPNQPYRPGSRANTGGLYVLPLTREPAKAGETDIQFEKPKAPVQVTIDFDRIDRRIRKLSTQDPDSGLTVTADGKIYFLSEGDLWYVSYDGKDTKRLTDGGGRSSLTVAKDGKKAFVVKREGLAVITFRSEGNAVEKEEAGAGPSPTRPTRPRRRGEDDVEQEGAGAAAPPTGPRLGGGGAAVEKEDAVEFKADWDHDIRADRLAAFNQFWRAYNERFYDFNMHGRDWPAIRKRYEPLLDAVATREEFATLLAMMVGELEASHADTAPAAGGPASQVTPHLGFTFDYSYHGPGIRVDTVPVDAPGWFAESKINPGDYIFTINGKAASLDENLFKDIADQQGRVFEFLVNSKPSRDGARTVKYASMTWDDWDALAYADRVERLRKYVEDKSGGRIGYIHISAMGMGDQQRFEREFYEYSLEKDGMIIDVRFNGGGNISSTLTEWLGRKPSGVSRGREAEPRPAPRGVWNKPIIVLMNEHSRSDAEMFPDEMRAWGLAKLVGMPTPGWVIGTMGMPLVDGTWARMPAQGIYRLDGSPMEDMGEQPDVKVTMTAEDWLAGRDPQVDKALELLLK